MFIATLIAKERLARGDISAAADAVAAVAGTAPSRWAWIDEGRAADIRFNAEPGAAKAALDGLIPATDIVVQVEAQRRRRLLVADMDSTMITVECLDELADYAGLKTEIAAITEQAMRGELAFEAALDARVALLAGMDEAAIGRCHDERVGITPGARALVRTMRREGAYCLLVSGGFDRFADRVAAAIGFDSSLSNRLGLAGGRLSGTVARPIVGAATKRQALLDAAEARGIPLGTTLAVGDGANDIPMIEAAGLGVAYHAKPVVAAAADARIAHNDLTALLYAQGFPRAEWEADS
jgi:phosphoserine phosphatase